MASQSSNTVDLPTPGSPTTIVLVPGNTPPSLLNIVSTMVPVLVGVNNESSNLTLFILVNLTCSGALTDCTADLRGRPRSAILICFLIFFLNLYLNIRMNSQATKFKIRPLPF